MEIFVVFFYFLVFQSQIVAVNVALENRSLLENGPEVVSISSESNNVSTSNESSLNVLNFQKSKAPIIPSNIDDLQVKEQVVSEPFVSSGSQKPASETASGRSVPPSSNLQEIVKPDHEVVKGSILTELPSLDSVAAEGINTHEIPTFNEFHAMVSEGTQSRKGQATEFGEDRIANSQYDLETEKGAKNAPDQTLEKVSHAHTDSNPIKISNTQGMHEAAIDDTISADGVSLPSDNGKPDSHLELQRQSLKVNSNLLPDMEMNSKGNSHVTPQPIITTTITDEAIHTPSKIDVTLRRNVAAVACGAKMLGSSKAIKNPEAVLNENNDEYMNVPCSEEKWLILEVCQPVQLRTIELANFELFSSRLKSFRVYASDRYPAKSWELIGTFAARDVKGIQSFSVTSGKMIKYVKFELTEHYGSEHYCPLTMIRIFGLGSDDLDDDDDDDDAVEVGVMNIPVTGNREPVIVVTNVKDQPLSSDHFPNVESEAVKLDNKTDEGFESTNTRMDDIHSASDPSISSQPTEDDSHIPSFNNEINTNLLYNHTKSINSEYVAPFLPLSTPEHNPNAVQNQADMNMDSSSDHSAMFSADTSASSPHIQHKGAVDSSKGVKNLHLSKETNSGFCRNDKLFQLLKDKPYCPVTFHCDYYYSNHGKHCAPNCQTTKLSNPAVLASQKPHIPKATTKTTPKVPVVALNHGVVSILSKNRTATNRSLQLHNKPFSPRVDEMNIFSRLINAVKNAVFNAISPFFSSIYDFSTDYDSSSYDVVPKLEHYLAVGYLFTQQGFSDPLCKDSLIYLKTDQIEGLWHLRTCLLLLNKIYAGGNTQSSNTAYTLLSWEDAAAASRLNECHQAAKQLNLTLSLHSHLSGYEISKSIMHMFIAYQNVKRNKALNRSKAIGSDSFYWNFLYDDVHNSDDYIMSCQPLDWKFQQLNTILWNGIIHKCSKLPLFLLSSVYSSSPPFTSDPVHTNDVDDNDEKMLVTNFHSSDDIVIGMNLKSSDHRLKTRKIDRQHSSNEALVVPASLGGSQGATAYMRLSNRVRIIERNVSVSMRYLEELSQSYRRQMERLSRSFNLTYAWLKLTASGAEERDRQQQHRIAQLESQLNDLIARLKLRVLNSLPSSTVNQPDSTLTSTTTSSSPSGSPSPSVPCSSGSSTPSPTASRSVHLVAPPVPPPLPDFESSLDWNPWLKSHSVDWDVVVDDVGSDDAEFESDESFTQDDVYLSKSSQKEKSKQTSSSSSATSSSIAGSHSVGGVSSSSSDNGGSNPNAYSSESIFYPHSSAHHQDYSHKKSSSNWKQLIYDWLWIQFTWSMALLDLGLYVYKLCQENSTTCNTFSLVCLHLILASITHLFIYWTWLRPQNHKITFDTELFLSSLYRTLCSNKSHQNLSNIVIYFNPCHTRKTQATNNRLVTTSPLPPSPTDDCVTHEVEQDENNEQNRGESLGKASISNHTVSACCQLDNFLQCCRCKPSLSASSSSTVLIGGNSTDDFIQTDVIGNNYALEENTKTANNDDHSTELHDSGVINHKFSDICGITLIHHAHNCKVGMHLCDSKKDLKISSNSNLVSDNNSPSVDCINVALPGQSILSKQCNRHRQFLSLPELPTTSQLDHLKLESVISKCDEDYGMESVCQLRHNELMICPNSLSSMQTNASSSFSLTPPLSLCDHIGTTNSNDVNDGSHLHDKTLGLTANHHQSAENSISTWTSTFHKRNTRPNKRRRKRLSEINDSLCKF